VHYVAVSTQMFIDERSRAADVMGTKNTARLPWLASMPSAASELVCVGKIWSNGVSQSLFIDRSQWPPKTTQHNGGRPHQTRAAAVVAAAAVAAAAPKVICISPVTNPQRSHTVIRRAATSAHHHHHHHHHQQQEQNKTAMHDKQQTGGNDVPIIAVDSAVAAASLPRPSTSKRSFEQTQDCDLQQLRGQLRSVAHAKAKAAKIIADVDAVDASSRISAVLPGSSLLLPGWASASKRSADGRHLLRPLLPRTGNVDVAPACAMTNVITIVPTTSVVAPPCKKPASSSVVIPGNESPSSTAVSPLTPSGVASSTAESYQTISDVTVSATAACTASAVQCLHRSSETTQSSQVEYNRSTNEPGVSRSQLLQRIRLIECEMTSPDNNAHAAASPFYINIVPLQASTDDKTPSQRLGMVADVASDNMDDEQPPARMLEALRLVRKPSSSCRRDATVASSTSADTRTSSGDAAAASTSHQPHVVAPAPASTSVSSAAMRLVTMKLVNRPTK